jgi:hypothetical protein
MMRQLPIVLVLLSINLPAAHAQVDLPTPMDHYESFDVDLAGLALIGELMAGLDPL